MKFWYNNLTFSSNTVITASSQQATLPVTNLANDQKTLVWQTGNSLTTEYAVFDLGSAQAVSSVIIFNHNLTNADANIYVEANFSNSFGSPAFSQLLSWSSGAIWATFNAQTYRYWRVRFDKSSAAQTRQIGIIYLGSYYTVTQDPDYAQGYKKTRVDLSTFQTTYGGQEYSQSRNQYRNIETVFSMYPQPQADSFDTIAQTVGAHQTFFINCAPNIAPTDPELNEVIYVKYDALFEQDIQGYDAINASGYFYNVDMTFREQL